MHGMPIARHRTAAYLRKAYRSIDVVRHEMLQHYLHARMQCFARKRKSRPLKDPGCNHRHTIADPDHIMLALIFATVYTSGIKVDCCNRAGPR
eukprot:35638-Eustigmatos_ZCMA.PRE.1